MILITGATGNNGLEILKVLQRDGHAVRAMVRKESDTLPRGVLAVVGDFDDAASLDRALDGIERAFLLTPSTERAEEQQLRFVEAARRAGVRHLVKLSQFAPAADSPVRFLRYHVGVEAAIRDSGIDWTFLRPNLFMQGLLQFAGMIRDKGMFAPPIGDAKVSVVDVRDNAEVATAALTGEGHAGREIRFVDANEHDLRRAMQGVGMPAWQIEGLVEDYAHYTRGEAAEVTDGVETATGRRPRNFDDFARDYAMRLT